MKRWKSKFYTLPEDDELHPMHHEMLNFQSKAISQGFGGPVVNCPTDDSRPAQFLFKHWLLKAGDVGIGTTELLHLFGGYRYSPRELYHSRGYITANFGGPGKIRYYRYTPERFERLKKEARTCSARMPDGRCVW